MIAGVKQSGAERQIWRHNDTNHLQELLAAAGPQRPKLVVFESLYSMDGDWPRSNAFAISPNAMAP